MNKKIIAIGLAIVLVLALGVGGVSAAGYPSSKATAKITDIDAVNLVPTGTTVMGWTTILEQDIKTPNKKDLFIDVSLEAGLYTMTHVKSKGGTKDESMAKAVIKVRVWVGDELAYPGEVVFASRAQTLKAWFQGMVEDALVPDGNGGWIIDPELLEPEELELILETMNANSFNFIMPDLTSGVQTIKVQVMVASTTDWQEGSADAWATVGNGSVTVELVRMINQSETLDLVVD